MIKNILVAAIFTASSFANASYCEVSSQTVQEVHKWLHTPLELPAQIIVQSYIIPALRQDECVSSKVSEEELVILSERLMNDVLSNGYGVREVIQEFLYE